MSDSHPAGSRVIEASSPAAAAARGGGLAVSVRDTLAAARGRAHRDDPATPGSGGPAGNARLTAWTGLLLLALFAVELLTLLDLHGFISWHIVVGVILVPVSLVKTATTGWRIVRYYTGSRPYVTAGPPPLLLRLLGPLVVLTTLAVLGSGLALIATGTGGARSVLVSVGPRAIDAVTVHQACALAWVVVTGLHVLGRTIPAAQLAAGRLAARPRVAGGPVRLAALVAALAIGAAVSVPLLHASSDWTSGSFGDRAPHGPGAHGARER